MLEKIDIHITDHCNLNCRSCTHFSSIANEFFLDIDVFERDIKRLSELAQQQLGSMFLLGGEPLLHEELIDFFPIARMNFPNTNLIIITNGILLEKQTDRFWKACKRYNIQIWVSNYRLKLNREIVEERAKKFNVYIGYTTYGGDSCDMEQDKIWGKWKLDLEGKQNWVDSFEHCSIKNCVTLKNGKLYTCPTLAHIEHFNKFFNKNLEPCEYDYIDIFQVDSHQAILDTMVKPIPFCRYCKSKEFELGIWETTKKDISEWT